MSRELFRADIPVVVSPRRSGPNGVTSAPVPLSAALTLSPTATLSFTLADLRDRLFHLAFELSAADYPAIRDSQALRVDFAAFPHRFAELLYKPAAEPNLFSAYLVLPENASDERPLFTIFERNNFKNLKHLELHLSVSTDSVVRRAIADRAKRAESRIAIEQAAVAQVRDEKDALINSLREAEDRERSLREELSSLTRQRADDEAVIATLRSDLDATSGLRQRIAELEGEISVKVGEIGELRARFEETRGLRNELEQVRESLKVEVAAREKHAADAAALRDEATESAAKLNDAISEIERGNKIIARLEHSSKDSRQKVRLSSAVIEKQEAAVLFNERRIAELERDLRKTRDRLEMVELERDGLSARLNAAKEKLEEGEILQATNQQVIAYLNRQLNKRAIARRTHDESRATHTSSYDSSTTTS